MPGSVLRAATQYPVAQRRHRLVPGEELDHQPLEDGALQVGPHDPARWPPGRRRPANSRSCTSSQRRGERKPWSRWSASVGPAAVGVGPEEASDHHGPAEPRAPPPRGRARGPRPSGRRPATAFRRVWRRSRRGPGRAATVQLTATSVGSKSSAGKGKQDGRHRLPGPKSSHQVCSRPRGRRGRRHPAWNRGPSPPTMGAKAMAPVVQFRAAVALAGRFPALAGVDLSLDTGEVVLVVGANGAGKTSLLRACAGLLPVTVGRSRGARGRPDRGPHGRPAPRRPAGPCRPALRRAQRGGERPLRRAGPRPAGRRPATGRSSAWAWSGGSAPPRPVASRPGSDAGWPWPRWWPAARPSGCSMSRTPVSTPPPAPSWPS